MRLAILLVAAALSGPLTASLINHAQEPGKGPIPQQLSLARQVEILKLQHDQDSLQNKYNQSGCQQLTMDAQKSYQEDQGKIDAAKAAGLKELGLDPATHMVQDGTFYVGEKPAPQPPAKPAEAKKP